jgi:glycosyltransferase involved in cell wall biosynthesis
LNSYATVNSDDHLCAECGVSRANHHHAFTRKRYPFVAMLRIKNEARWITEVVKSTFHLCDKVFILDDHSTDDTVDKCLDAGKQVTVISSPFTGLNEARDKNYLYDEIIRECQPEWILCIDGDEVLEGSAGAGIRRSIAERPDIDAWALKIEFVWDKRGQVRSDRIYGDFWRPSLFRPFVETPGVPDSRVLAQEFRFQSTPFGRHVNGDQPNLHCSSVPQRRIHRFGRAHARLIHYGYMDRAHRVGKLDYYTSIDWKNDAEDWYRHMCQGDGVTLEELPNVRELLRNGTLSVDDVKHLLDVDKTTRLVHAGPVELRTIQEGAPWTMSDWAKSQQPAIIT